MRFLITVGLTLLVIGLWGAIIWSQTQPYRAVAASTAITSARSPGTARSGSAPSPSVLNADSISHGFIFIEGRYVEAPYRLETKETHLLLNGKYLLFKHETATSLPDAPATTQESESLSDSTELVRGLLQIDSCLFFDAQGDLRTSLGADQVATSFEVAIEILQSTRPVAEKVNLLQDAGVLHAGQLSETPELVLNFQRNEQLLERVKWLAQVRAAKPLEIQDLKPPETLPSK